MERRDGFEDQVRSIALLGDPVRRALFDYVASRGQDVGRGEASRAVGIERALAAFHLDKLVAEGLLDFSYRRLSGRQGPGAGRPAKVYRRSGRQLEVTIPRRRYELLARLLTIALDRSGDGPAAALVEASRMLGEQLGAEAREWAGARAGLRAQLEALESILAENGFEPLRGDDQVLRLRNCPFDALAREFTAIVCGANLAFMEGVLVGIGATGLAVGLEPEDGRCCVVFRALGA